MSTLKNKTGQNCKYWPHQKSLFLLMDMRTFTMFHCIKISKKYYYFTDIFLFHCFCSFWSSSILPFFNIFSCMPAATISQDFSCLLFLQRSYCKYPCWWLGKATVINVRPTLCCDSDSAHLPCCESWLCTCVVFDPVSHSECAVSWESQAEGIGAD